MQPTPKTLDVKKILGPILRNYDEHVLQFVDRIQHVSCALVYDGPLDFHQHILEKTTYACSIRYSLSTKKQKILKSIFPVMIGSRLDLWIRKRHICEFDRRRLLSSPPDDPSSSFHPIDIIPGFFIVCGAAKHLPYFFTNDPTNMHVIKNTIVRCYSYDVDDRGKELSFYMDHEKPKNGVRTARRGDFVVKLNDGTKTSDVEGFFDHCPYPTRHVPYMHRVFDMGRFDIDHLGNKAVISPGHMFVKLFMKYVYIPLRKGDWKTAKIKAAMIVKSIDGGELLHVLSRKTLYQREASSAAKMVSNSHENRREIGMKGEVYVEKLGGCYREITQQTYPLNPYLTHMIIRQISSKVKNNSAIPFHPSYMNFLCLFGTFETKNIGRTNIMTRDTYVSTNYDMDSVFRRVPGQKLYETLNLQPDPQSDYYVVVNEACVPVTENCFHGLDLVLLKNRFTYIECYVDGRFICIRYKVGLFFKKMGSTVWVTPRDERYWADRLYGLRGDTQTFGYEGELPNVYALKMELADKFGYDYNTGHHVDLNPYFAHNSFAKVIWAFHSLKNAVLATDPKYSLYFMEPLSAYTDVSEKHRIVCEPVDDYSRHFAMYMPRVNVAYMSFQGMNQEDGIVVREDLRAFDCHRIVTLRLKLNVSPRPDASVTFQRVVGDPHGTFLGTIVCDSECTVKMVPQSYVHVKPTQKSPYEIDIAFKQEGFMVLEPVYRTSDGLVLILIKFHRFAMGDKLCSFSGQKGIGVLSEQMPTLDGVPPDLILNPYCMFHMTPGQLMEARDLGGGRDALVVRNSKGVVILDAKVFSGEIYYFPIAFWSCEHLYAPTDCVVDKIIGQAVRGRSRQGGMRIGNMELMNCLRGNGIAACFEEKFIKDGDGMLIEDGICIPKSANLCMEDAKFFKCDIRLETEPCVTTMEGTKLTDDFNKKDKMPSPESPQKHKVLDETLSKNSKKRKHFR